MASTNSRPYDLILLGVTGFTGRLTAEHITKNLPGDLKWAVAGRNHEKISAIVEGLKGLNSNRKPPAIEITEIFKEKLDNLVRKTRVLITTTGPYHLYGAPVIEACAKAGTHYLDCTGETPWVYDIAHKYHKLAESNRAILISQCSMESAPADLVAYILAGFIRKQFSNGTADLVHSVQKFDNTLSGGTLRSLITVASSYPFSHLRKSLQPFSLYADKPPIPLPSNPHSLGMAGSHFVSGLGLLSDSVIGIPDTTLVNRSWSLMDGGKYYGSNFAYFTGMKTSNRIVGFLWHHALSFSLLLLLIPPLRWLLTKVVPQPGNGPPEEAQAKQSTIWKSLAHSDSEPSQTVICNMSFDKDMYSLTAILLAEAAVVLLRPDRENWAQQLGGGVLTPATLGDQFVERIKAAGVNLELEVPEDKGSAVV